MANNHDWMTLHRVRFPEVVDGAGKPLPGPASAQIWRFAPLSMMGPDGHFNSRNDSWGGFALHSSREEAEAVFDDPDAHLPFLDRTLEAWHAIAIPFAHRGGVKWRGMVEHDSAIKVASADPKGPLAVLTSAGYTDPGPEDEERIKAFSSGILNVIDFYGTLPGNLRRGVFSGGGVDGREGCTISLWRDDKSMIGAAYKSGIHKAQLERHQSSPLFDHSSFTRARILASKGTWDGTDPIDELRN
jgi:hypothetical protein